MRRPCKSHQGFCDTAQTDPVILSYQDCSDVHNRSLIESSKKCANNLLRSCLTRGTSTKFRPYHQIKSPRSDVINDMASHGFEPPLVRVEARTTASRRVREIQSRSDVCKCPIITNAAASCAEVIVGSTLSLSRHTDNTLITIVTRRSHVRCCRRVWLSPGIRNRFIAKLSKIDRPPPKCCSNPGPTLSVINTVVIFSVSAAIGDGPGPGFDRD